jgi:hypothetical protein
MEAERSTRPRKAIWCSRRLPDFRSVREEFDFGHTQARARGRERLDGNGRRVLVGGALDGRGHVNPPLGRALSVDGKIEAPIRTGRAGLVQFDGDEVAAAQQSGAAAGQRGFKPRCFLGRVDRGAGESAGGDCSSRHIAAEDFNAVEVDHGSIVPHEFE